MYGSVVHEIPLEHDENENLAHATTIVTEPNLCSLDKVMDFKQWIWCNDNRDHIIDPYATA